MQAIKINPELGAVKEKVFFGFELWQVADIFLGMLASLGLVLLLPDMGMFKGLICSIPALPFVLIAHMATEESTLTSEFLTLMLPRGVWDLESSSCRIILGLS